MHTHEHDSPGIDQPAYGVQAPPPSGPSPDKKRRGWITVLVTGSILVALAGCCLWPLVLVFVGMSDTDFYGNGIAVIHVDGVIAGTASGGYLGGGGITPEYLIDLLRAADEDPGIEAILLRIDSPGGTVAASQEIAMEVARVQKPIVASVGDVAASGAYWIASQCDVIVATPSSAIGSIGVIMQIPNYEGLMEILGVEFTVLTKGEFKDAGSPYRSLTATEMAMLDEDMDFVYQMFIEGVAEGRGLDVKDVEEMATGWVWSAAQAQGLGLVDELGTYQDGLDAAADIAGLDSYEVIYYDEPSALDLLYWLLTVADRIGRIGEATTGGAVAPPVVR